MTLVLYLHVSRVLSFLFCDDLTTCHQKKKKKSKIETVWQTNGFRHAATVNHTSKQDLFLWLDVSFV